MATGSRAGGQVPVRGLWGRTGYVLSCLMATMILLVSGICYFVVQAVASIGGSHAIVSGPSIGPQNILLMGLESRRDWAGNILPSRILAKLHAGSRQGVENGVGGNDTNTLILIHIPAGGRKAVGFSIPRDDWVSFAGTVGPQQQGKIDQAYGVSMYYEQAKLRDHDPHMSQDTLAYLGNEAGRRAAVATVEKLTGVHVDHFAEVNLDGFYELARVFGGVQVCLRHPVSDSYSGAHFRAGLQHLDASQALAFVRQRHGLQNGDLDRTHRQQAFIDSVMHQMHTEGILSDLSKVSALLSVAKQYVITDSGWNLLDFAAEMRGLTSGNLVFRTLPIKGYALIDGQDSNVVQPAYIKSIVQAAFYPKPGGQHVRRAARHHPAGPKPLPAGQVTVDVRNGGQTAGLAGEVSAALVRAGYRAGEVGNTSARAVTAVRYGSGAAGNAAVIAAAFKTGATASASVPAGHVEILLGASAGVPVIQSSPPKPRPSPTASPSAGAAGGAVVAKDGIPCVN
jgi:LCP family protein required for cell wall assembly